MCDSLVSGRPCSVGLDYSWVEIRDSCLGLEDTAELGLPFGAGFGKSFVFVFTQDGMVRYYLHNTFNLAKQCLLSGNLFLAFEHILALFPLGRCFRFHQMLDLAVFDPSRTCSCSCVTLPAGRVIARYQQLVSCPRTQRASAGCWNWEGSCLWLHELC